MADRPSLPSVYELIALDSVGDVFEEAKSLAAHGAEEGTLLWAREQTAPSARFGPEWASAPGNLYSALILRPEESPSVAAQLALVASVAVGSAIAELVAPMTELRYLWPDKILLNEGRVAGLALEAENTQSGALKWMVLGATVNVKSGPPRQRFAAATLQADGDSDATDSDVLERFARHFLAGINRWASEGFSAVRNTWLQRADGIGDPIDISLPQNTLSGTLVDLDRSGGIVLALPDGRKHTLPLTEYFSIPSGPLSPS